MFEKTENKRHPVLALTLVLCVAGAFTFSLTDITLRFIKVYDDISASEGFITVLSHGIDCLVDNASNTGKPGKNLLLSSRNGIPRASNFIQIQNNETGCSNLFIHTAVDYHYFIDITCIQTRLRI
jgi:hypothetical protein